MLASPKRELGDLDRLDQGRRSRQRGTGLRGSTTALDGFSDLILALDSPEAGMHARTAPGVATLPVDHAVFVAAEAEIRSRVHQ